MRCPDCGHNNPDDDNFCGICGEPLSASPRPATNYRGVAELEAAAAPPVPLPIVAIEDARENPRAAVSRPERVEQRFTFGMSAAWQEENTPAKSGDGRYPFDDEVRTSSFAKYVSVLALLILGLLIAKEWRPLKQQVMDALRPRHPAAQPATTQPGTAPVPAPATVPGVPSESSAAGGGGSPARTGQPQASLPAQPTPGEARAAVSSRKPRRAHNGKASKLRPGQPQPGRRRRTKARPLVSAGRQPGY